VAKRWPSGTLHNKAAPQAQQALHLAYCGGRGGATEGIGYNEQSQPGYACLIPGEKGCEIVITDDVRFVPMCRPGLKRTAGGGWIINDENVKRYFAGKPEQTESGGEHEAPDDDNPVDITPDMQASTVDATESFEIILGWPSTEDVQGRGGSVPAGDEGEKPTDEPEGALAPPPEPEPNITTYLVPRSHWPDYPCDEHDGLGWEVTIVQKRPTWWFVHFINGGFANEWRKAKDLIPVVNGVPQVTQETPSEEAPRRGGGDEIATEPQSSGVGEQETVEPPSELPFAQPSPNEHTAPAEGFEQMQEPTRPQRNRQQPDRFNPAALAAKYAEIAAVGYDLQNNHHRLSDQAFVVDIDHTCDRLMDRINLPENSSLAEAAAFAADIRVEFETLAPQVQRAAAIMMDHDEMVEAFGHTSDQAKMCRELYAMACLSAACEGFATPALEPLFVGTDGSKITLTPNELFRPEHSGQVYSIDPNSFDLANEIFAAAKVRSSPDDFTERQMKGPEWDEPKELEKAKIFRLEAMTKVAADDPCIKGMRVDDTMCVGRNKRGPDGEICKRNCRIVARGDKVDKMDSNSTMTPVTRTSSMCGADAVGCIRRQHYRDGDVPGAYLQGKQFKSEQRVYRAPHGMREWDERGVEILWLSNNPLYGQPDAGAIWNRTLNDFYVNECKYERCSFEPCVYSKQTDDGSYCTSPIYVDDLRMYYDPSESACKEAEADCKRMKAKFDIDFKPPDPRETFFLGANRITYGDKREVVQVTATSYIDLQVKRFADGDVSPCKRFPSHWSHTPADDTLVRDWESAMQARTPATKEFTTKYQCLFGALLHATKFRPEISAAMGLLGACLTFPNEALYEHLMHVLVYLGRTRKMGLTYSANAVDATILRAYADSNWGVTRSTTGFCIMLAGAAITSVSRRQHCITMSSCEAELVALADCAIELIHILGVVEFIGFEHDGPIEACSDSKSAVDLCHRFTSAQNSRHVDRKLFKMRELRGAGVVTVRHVPGETNPADIFTKILGKQTFEKHRKTVLNVSPPDHSVGA
jgi:hypothetical protein